MNANELHCAACNFVAANVRGWNRHLDSKRHAKNTAPEKAKRDHMAAMYRQNPLPPKTGCGAVAPATEGAGAGTVCTQGTHRLSRDGMVMHAGMSENTFWVWGAPVEAQAADLAEQAPELLEREHQAVKPAHTPEQLEALNVAMVRGGMVAGGFAPEAHTECTTFEPSKAEGMKRCSECRTLHRDDVAPAGSDHAKRLEALATSLAAGRGTTALDRLDLVSEIIAQAETLRAQIVVEARQQSASWTAIGSAAGVTRQAARQRWGRLDETSSLAHASTAAGEHPDQLTID